MDPFCVLENGYCQQKHSKLNNYLPSSAQRANQDQPTTKAYHRRTRKANINEEPTLRDGHSSAEDCFCDMSVVIHSDTRTQTCSGKDRRTAATKDNNKRNDLGRTKQNGKEHGSTERKDTNTGRMQSLTSNGSLKCVQCVHFSFSAPAAAGLEDSEILKTNASYLKVLSEYLNPVVQSNSHWKRCWRASLDGWAAATFHANCDDKGPTVTIIRVGKYIFGGYTSASWTSRCQWPYDSAAFLFSLVNEPGWQPLKLNQTGKYSSYRCCSIYSCSSHGPTFGNGYDIYIADHASSNTNSGTNLGVTYGPPSGYSYGSSDTRRFLAGSLFFQPDEVEVFFETT
ncbi:hypothetical protein ACROYT_G032300 [Oculina patagonica]